MTPQRIEIIGFREPHTGHKLVPVRFRAFGQDHMASEWGVKVHQYRRGGK